jgi:alpha-glucosidase
VLSNHDQPRHASRLAASVGVTDPAAQDAIARAAAVLLLTVRGTPFLYYGEELGMGDVAIPPAERIDRAADRADAEFSWWDRSPARTPLPWAPGPGAGFSTGRPWLRLGPDAATRNVAVQRDDPTSTWSGYRRMLALRRSQPSLQDGSLHLVPTGDPTVLAFRRDGSGPEMLIAIAFGADGGETRLPRPIRGGGWRPIGGTSLEPSAPEDAGRRLRLRGYEAVILVADAGRHRP